MISSLRGHLTLWYLGAFSVVLIIFSFAVYFLVNRILYERLNTNLRSTLHIAVAAVSRYESAASSMPTLEDLPQPNQLILLLDRDGRVLAKKPANSPVPARVSLPLRPVDSPQFYQLSESSADADDSCRGVYQRVLNASNGVYYFVGVVASDEMLSDQLDTLQNVLIGAVLLALLVVGSVGWLLAKRSLLPLATMVAITERISVNNLAERVPVQNPEDELGRLATRFNDLLSRLDQAFVQQRQFMADASHELRTPLSAVRTAAQVALQQRQRTEPEYRDALMLVEKQSARLGRIVDDMFALARADMGQLPLEITNVHLEEIIAEVVATMKVLAAKMDLELQADCEGEASFRGDESLLRRMISNLVDNAIKYTPSGGRLAAMGTGEKVPA